MTDQLDHFYLDQDEPNQSCLLSLRQIILAQDNQISETRKYGMPCFCYGKKMFCYLWTDKKTKHPYILMVEGNRIDHPALEAGKRARMKVLNINPNEDIPIDIVETILVAGIELYKNGTIKI